MKKIIKLLLVFVSITCINTALMFAQSADKASSESKSKIVLEVYLDKADRSYEQSEWFTLAESGKRAALGIFESEFLHNADSETVEAARREFLGTLEKTQAERYRTWLVDRFLEAKTKNLSNNMLALALEEADKTYLYEHDANGNILKDSNGLMVTKKTEGLEADNTQWLNIVNTARDSLVKGFSDLFASSNMELAGLFKGRTADFSALDTEFKQSFAD